MKTILIICTALSFGIILSCSGSDDNDEVATRATFDDFSAEVVDSVPAGSRDCGSVNIGESHIPTNTCAADAYMLEQEFYAIYQLQGIDSLVGGAITLESDGALYIWSYDSDPSGGVPVSDSRIDKDRCQDAQLSGTLDSTFLEVFTCASN